MNQCDQSLQSIGLFLKRSLRFPSHPRVPKTYLLIPNYSSSFTTLHLFQRLRPFFRQSTRHMFSASLLICPFCEAQARVRQGMAVKAKGLKA